MTRMHNAQSLSWKVHIDYHRHVLFNILAIFGSSPSSACKNHRSDIYQFRNFIGLYVLKVPQMILPTNIWRRK